MNVIKNIFFVSYLKNKGIRRLCFVLGILLAIRETVVWYDYEDSIEIDYFYILGLLWPLLLCFYLPFLLSCIVKWIYTGFKEK